MPRHTPSPIVAMPTRKTRAPARPPVAAILRAPQPARPVDDPLELLAADLERRSATLTGHGKPVGGLPVFGERRSPARRAGFRTPPR